MPYSQSIDLDYTLRSLDTVVVTDMRIPFGESFYEFDGNESVEHLLEGGERPEELVELESEMATKSVKVQRTFGAGGSIVNMEAAVPRDVNTTILTAGTTPDHAIEIQLDLAVDMDDGNVFEDRVFTGVLQKASITEKNVLKLKFMDRRDLFNRYRVQLDTRDSGETTVAILRNLLGEEVGLEEGDDFVIDISEPELVKTGYGVDNRVPIGNVIRDLAAKQGAGLWIDEYNVIHFEDFEPRQAFVPLGAISFNAGEGKNNVEDVIVSTSYDSTGVGRFSGFGNEIRNGSVNDSESDAGGQAMKLTDNNVTPAGAQKKAEHEYKMSVLKSDSGEIEIVGDPRIKPLDRIKFHDIPRTASIGSGYYTAKSVTHKFDSKNGFTTKIGLTKDMQTAFEGLFERNEEALGDDRVEEQPGMLVKYGELLWLTRARNAPEAVKNLDQGTVDAARLIIQEKLGLR